MTPAAALRLVQALLEALDRDLQALRLGRLEHVVDGAALERFHRVLVVGGDEHDAGCWSPMSRAASMPVLPGMRMSRKVRSGLQLGDQLDGFVAVLGFADDLQLRPDLGQAHAQLVAHQSFVVGNDCGGMVVVTEWRVSIIQ